MISKAKIEKKLERKTNPELVETIILAKKNSPWIKVANKISGPARKKMIFNLDEIDSQIKEGETAVIPGKVLSLGEIRKKVKISALDFSEKAKEKLKKAGVGINTILEEIKKNPDAKNVKILEGKN